MEVEIFTLADYAAITGNGKLTIVGTFDTLFAQQLPALQHCSVVLKMRLANSEAGNHTVQLKFLDPDGKEFVPSLRTDITSGVNQHADYNPIVRVMNLAPMKLEKVGKYAIELYYDDEFHSGLKLTLIRGMMKAA